MQPDAAARRSCTQDALRIPSCRARPLRLVANLPYNISVPVLLHFLEHFPSIHAGIVMVQAEVGQRIAAAPGSKVYGSPSVKAAWYGDWRTAGNVSRQVFWPVPNVDSVLVGFERRDRRHRHRGRARSPPSPSSTRAFQQRRKMLRQSLSGVLGDSRHGIRRHGGGRASSHRARRGADGARLPRHRAGVAPDGLSDADRCVVADGGGIRARLEA